MAALVNQQNITTPLNLSGTPIPFVTGPVVACPVQLSLITMTTQSLTGQCWGHRRSVCDSLSFHDKEKKSVIQVKGWEWFLCLLYNLILFGHTNQYLSYVIPSLTPAEVLRTNIHRGRFKHTTETITSSNSNIKNNN